MDGQLTLLVVAALPVSGTVIAVALVVLALVVAIGGFLVYRSGGKKGAKAATGTANADWQRQTQGQQNGAGNWNPQGAGNDAPAWSQQNQGQPNNSWGGQGQPNQQQQAQQPAWNAQPPMQQQQAASPWGAPAGMPQPQQTGPWGGGQGNAQGQNGNQWGGGTQPAANQWDAQGNQMNAGGGRAPWEAEPAPVAQEPWNQPPPASPQQQWGGQANMQQPQQAPNAFGGGGMSSGPAWNQPNFAGGPNGQNGQNAQAGMNGQADAWLAPQAQNAPNNAAGGFAGALGTVPQPQAWQQPSAPQQQSGGGVQQQQQTPPFAGADGGFLANDGDKTMMRPSGGLGLVRVEEGKEPGREYKIVKESLSIGRSRESDIFLEDLAVSRLHASVVNQGNGQYALKDEGSANGTKVNGQLVGKFQVFPLQEGDRIQLGQTVLVFARN